MNLTSPSAGSHNITSSNSAVLFEDKVMEGLAGFSVYNCDEAASRSIVISSKLSNVITTSTIAF